MDSTGSYRCDHRTLIIRSLHGSTTRLKHCQRCPAGAVGGAIIGSAVGGTHAGAMTGAGMLPCRVERPAIPWTEGRPVTHSIAGHRCFRDTRLEQHRSQHAVQNHVQAQPGRGPLAQDGVDPRRYFVVGRGQDEAVADNATEAGRAANRRGKYEFFRLQTA